MIETVEVIFPIPRDAYEALRDAAYKQGVTLVAYLEHLVLSGLLLDACPREVRDLIESRGREVAGL